MTEMQWRDISEAPKDGTEILGRIGPKDVRLIWYFRRSANTTGFLDAWGRDVKPTHWVPMPSEPSGDHQAQGGMK